MNPQDFEDRLKELRPRLHRYCARMTGSTVDGEDVLQEALIKALQARADGTVVDNLEGWLLRIAHNTSLDFLRRRSRHKVVPLVDDMEDARLPELDIVAVGFQAFMRLPELQRCAVILKDVLGYQVEEIAEIADCTHAAAKSALQRARAALRHLAARPDDVRLPLLSDASRQKMAAYVRLFKGGDFDAIRSMLAEDVRLDLVNRLKLEGREDIRRYFARYAEETRWRYELGAIEGRPAMLVFDGAGRMEEPAHFVLLDWRKDEITTIRDYLFAPYVLETADWIRLP
ncbi:MAG TPA: sigma-70 family RNA polymerase sigma factor [Ensifer sp.]|jgi:RNA polymerase sigma-70 factor (ECF subfamily)|uniref:sigma-70 family RNA polymerase sigma factor n=1 Tax=Ensifer sp. TaxID=1872086 RepID=UPI002E0DCC6D|nr:sigma-70 family RNA polymerase sigma factor [Ensifer sp.]